MNLSGVLARAALFLMFTYLAVIGATFNGMVIPSLRFVALGLVGILTLLWAGLHLRNGWRWHRTPLDVLLPLWGFAFILALAANAEVWRRIMIGWWYAGLYVAVWYFVCEAFGNCWLKRDTMADGLLFAGLIVLLFGYIQASALPFDLSSSTLPRPGSTLGNPNSLGAFLVVLLPIAAGRTLFPRHAAERLTMLVYTFATGLLLFLTFSRGAWLGGAAGLGMVGLVSLLWNDLTSPAKLAHGWQSRPALQKALLLMAGGLFIAGALVAGVLLARSFTLEGRSTALRTELYTVASALFLEKPLTGHGLYTFGRGLEQRHSMPPQTPHSHAHNLPLHLAAELGLPGLIAAGVSVVMLLRAMQSNLKTASKKDWAVIGGATGAMIGFGTHHLLDTPFMMPLIALMGVAVLAMATFPLNPSPLEAQWRRAGHPFGILGLCGLLCLTGAWGTLHYDRYVAALSGASAGNYAAAARAMNPVIAAEPALSLYRWQQAYLYGMASLADPTLNDAAVAAYTQVVENEPQNAIAWANLGALHWQNGDSEAAINAMRRALQEAPLAWQFRLNLGMYLEASGERDEAADIYNTALSNTNVLYPFWQETRLRRELAAQIIPSADARLLQDILAAYTNDTVLDEAEVDHWWQSRTTETTANTVVYVLALMMLSEPPPNTYLESLLVNAETLALSASDEENRAWVALGRAWLARQSSDMDAYAGYLRQARSIEAYDIATADFIGGLNLGYALFGRYIAPRQFLPGVVYPTISPLLAHLLAHS